MLIMEDVYERIEFYISGISDKLARLEDILYIAQTELGYLPIKIQEFISEKTEISLADIQNCIIESSSLEGEEDSAITILVCVGARCSSRGSRDILKEFERQLEIKAGSKTADGKIKLDVKNCFGKCAVGPNVFVDSKHYRGVSEEDVDRIILEID